VIQDKIATLRRVWGDDCVDDFLYYFFEYACHEASYLQLREACEDHHTYVQAFDLLCHTRLRHGIEAIIEQTKALHKASGVDYSKLKNYFKIMPQYDAIEGLIHNKYHPPMEVNQLDNIRLLGDGTANVEQ
jgi:hypothetical protein